MHALIGHGGGLVYRLLANSHAAAQHPGAVAMAQVTRILRQHHLTKTHLQFVFHRGFGSAGCALRTGDAVGEMERQFASRPLVQGRWQLDVQARQVGIHRQLGRAPAHHQCGTVGAVSLQKTPQLRDGANRWLLPQALCRKHTLRVDFDLMPAAATTARLAYRNASAHKRCLAPQQRGRCILQAEAFFIELHLALALRQQRRIGRDAHIVVLQCHRAFHNGLLHVHDGQPQRQLNIGCAIGRSVLQAIAGDNGKRRLVGERQRLLQRPPHIGRYAHCNVCSQIRNVRRQITHHDIRRHAETRRGVEHRQRRFVEHQQAVELRQRRPGFFVGVLQVAGHEMVFGIGQRHFKTESARLAAMSLVKRHMCQIPLNAHARIANVAAAHGMADVIQRNAPQRARQIAHHLLGSRPLKMSLQIQHAGKTFFGNRTLVGAPSHARRALGICIGKTHFRQCHPYLLPLNTPPHLGVQRIKCQTGLFKHAGKFGATPIQIQLHTAARLIEVESDVRPLHARRTDARWLCRGGLLRICHRWGNWGCCRINNGLPHGSLRQPTDAASTATRRIGHGRVQIALPAQVQIVHLTLWLVAPQGLEHGLAQRQALRQLADHADIPIIALDFAAACSRAFCIVIGHLQIAPGPAQIVIGFKRQPFGAEGVAVAQPALVEAEFERALQPLQRQWRQVFSKRDIHRLQP